jgi:tetratricopeptide (TPR) repeat protein
MRNNVETPKRRNVETWRRKRAGGMVAVLGMSVLGLAGPSDPLMAEMNIDSKELSGSSVLPASSEERLTGSNHAARLGQGLVLASTEAGASADGAGEASVDPYEAVRQGNDLLKQDRPREALRYYEQAAKEKPDAREIAFGEGLAHYHLGDYEKARELFRRAADGKNDALADDAMYSLGTTYHSDALLSKDDPRTALGLLEEAMQHYQGVLGHRPDHEAARDAYRKAGTMWRYIKQQMEQQQQPQQSDQSDEDEDKQDEQTEQQKEQDQQQNQDQDQEQEQERKGQQKESEDQQEEEPQPSPSDEQREADQEQQDSTASEPQEDEQEQPQSARDDQDEKEGVSREQAERKLREMMHELRERRRERREPSQPMPMKPVDKDW